MRRMQPLQSLVPQEVLQMQIHKELPLVAPLQKANQALARARIRLATSLLSFRLLLKVVLPLTTRTRPIKMLI